MTVLVAERLGLHLERLAAALAQAWRRESSADPAGWSADNPAWGQCAVTALIVQDHCGGELLHGTVCGQSHYWNRLDSGREVDLTMAQFEGQGRPANAERRERDYVLSFPDTRKRYQRLRMAVEQNVAAGGQ
jgi:hypothetical protein